MPPPGLTPLGEAIYTTPPVSVKDLINDDTKDEVDVVSFQRRSRCAMCSRVTRTFGLTSRPGFLAPQTGRTPLFYACLVGNAIAAEELCEAGADVNYVRSTSLAAGDRARSPFLSQMADASWATCCGAAAPGVPEERGGRGAHCRRQLRQRR